MIKKAVFSKAFLVIVVFIGLALALSMFYIDGQEAKRDNSIELLMNELEEKGLKVSLIEFQKGRSENFAYSKLPQILTVNDEEIFIFQYGSKRAVNRNLKLTYDFDRSSTYWSATNIFLYRGDYLLITELLKSELNALQNDTP